MIESVSAGMTVFPDLSVVLVFADLRNKCSDRYQSTVVSSGAWNRSHFGESVNMATGPVGSLECQRISPPHRISACWGILHDTTITGLIWSLLWITVSRASRRHQIIPQNAFSVHRFTVALSQMLFLFNYLHTRHCIVCFGLPFIFHHATIIMT